MIERIIIRNFKGIIYGEVNLRQLTIITGPNNSGKTTILEALLLAGGTENLPYGYNPFNILFKSYMILEDRGLEHLIHGYGITKAKAIIGYIHDGRRSAISIDADDSYINIYLLDNVKDFNESSIEEVLKSQPPIAKFYRFGYGGRYTYKSFIAKVLYIRSEILMYIYDLMRGKWTEIIGKIVVKDIMNWLSKCLSEKYVDIVAKISGDRIEALYLYKTDGSGIRFSDLSDGVKLLLGVRIAYEYSKPNILLWDDVESHMNPRMMIVLAEWISELVEDNVQVILTTHSYEAIRAIASLTVGEKVKIVRLNLRDGVLKARYYSLNEIEELKNLGIDIRA